MENNEVTKTEEKIATPGERFTQSVLKQFAALPGEVELTSFQQKLIQNYFIKLDSVLKAAELKRMKTPDDKRDHLSFEWKNVNLDKLAVDVVAYSMVKMDPLQPNHINLIPFKNSATGKYDINFMTGYRGKELIAFKYGIDPVPTDITIEVIHENDLFISHRKDRDNPVETYEFKELKPFDKGEVVGGFYYIQYADPSKNKLRTFSKKDIDKRKPQYASAEFWGGERTVWKDNKAAGKEKVEGWYEEMAWKTIARAAYSSITIDSEKIDDSFVAIMQAEAAELPETATDRVQQEIAGNANTEDIKFDEVKELTSPPMINDGLFAGDTTAEKQPAKATTKKTVVTYPKPETKQEPGF